MDKTYEHPGGKLRRMGANHCSEKELLAIIFNSVTNKHSTEKIAEILFEKFGGLNNIIMESNDTVVTRDFSI